MLVTVTCTDNDQVYALEVSPDMELENFKALVQVETGTASMEAMVFLHNGRVLVGDQKTLAALHVRDGDVLLFGPRPAGTFEGTSTRQANRQPRPRGTSSPASILQPGPGAGIDWSSVRLPGASTGGPSRPPTAPSTQARNLEDPDTIRQLFLNDPHQLSLLKERNPRLAEALLSNNREEFARVLEEQRRERLEQERNRIRLLAADPFDLEAQARIEEEIRMDNVNQNMQTAMEYSPENFAEVYMLYINCKINGHPVKAFVDSGAQMTIMSKACAERCNIMRLIDHRWQGVAVGVGQQKIIGRVHMGQLQIEDTFLPSSFTILEQQPMDVLLGLDMLKRHQCCIDLRLNELRIGTTNTTTRFLHESELPECARLNRRGQLNQPEADSAGMHVEEEDLALQEAILKSQNGP